jgi:pimeloyl-ACP methyl ester carboxylesterase
MELNLPEYLKKEYPFKSNFFKISNDEYLHYVDEGTGPVIIMLHGNPTWSYFYRNLIKHFSKNYRVIVPDHLGMGLSSKNPNSKYTLKNRIEQIEILIDHLKIDKFSLVLHDWGGAIGMGVATKRPDSIIKIMAMNTAAFTSKEIPFRIAILKNKFGGHLIQKANLFALPATFMAVSKKLKNNIRAGYLYPYDSYNNRRATSTFVQDIPLNENHPSYQTLIEIEQNLKLIKSPILLLWGEKDFCFTTHFLNRWLEFFPKAKYKIYPNANHYLVEDEASDVTLEIEHFLKS